MNKPIKRFENELQDAFVDFLYDTYEPQKNSAGEYFFNGLDYLTNEMTYMTSETEKEFIEEHGFAPIGFLEVLRIHMAKSPQGFGLCINDKSLKKALSNIEIDYDIEREQLMNYYNLLLENHLLIIINDKAGNKYVTTLQQLFNWEYKMWTRWTNNEYQKKRRTNNKKIEDTTPQNNSVEEQSQGEQDSINETPSIIAPAEAAADETIFDDVTDDFDIFS